MHTFDYMYVYLSWLTLALPARKMQVVEAELIQLIPQCRRLRPNMQRYHLIDITGWANILLIITLQEMAVANLNQLLISWGYSLTRTKSRLFQKKLFERVLFPTSRIFPINSGSFIYTAQLLCGMITLAPGKNFRF